MRRGELVTVFPGGGREVNKRKNEQYKLVWKNRLGFARLAIQHGYPIVPFASVGAEHGDPNRSVIGRLLRSDS
jgi:1-acyl-sn-glycerol-3-phosphate acyltransferase